MTTYWFSREKTAALIGFTLVILMILSLGNTLTGQTPYLPKISEPLNESWRWRNMEILSAKGVRCMADDHEGNMWFGLNKGLMRYDGYNWELFDDQPCLKSPVGTLFQSAQGRLYAGSEAGLLVFKEDKWEKIFPENDSIQVPITTITQMPDGSILAGIQNGMLLYNENDIHIFTALPNSSSFTQNHPNAKLRFLPDEVLFQRNFGRVDDIFVEQDGRIWLFMSRNNDGKLIQFNIQDTLNRVLQKYQIADALGGYKLSNRNQMLQTADGNRWLINGFYKNGILKHDGKAWERLKLSDTFGGDELHTDIMELSNGSLWIGGLGKLYVYKNNGWKDFSAPLLPIPSSRILFHEARNGQIWVAGLQGDVFRLSHGSEKWVKYKGLNFQLKDKLGREWFLSVDGKIVFNQQEQWLAYKDSPGMIDAPVKLIATRDGRIWAAGSHQGIAATAYLKDGEWHRQIHSQVSWGIDSRSVFQDKEGSLWFGASVDRQESLGQISGVLQLLNPDGEHLQWKHHTQNDGIAQHNVYGIGQSPDGNMWLGGTNLLQLDGQRWKTLTGNELLNEFVDIVHSGQHLWVGSRFYGLFRFDGEKWTQYSKNHGLPNNTIISIFEESPEKVWVITDKDIARFDGKSWFSGIFPASFRIPREGGDISVDSDGYVWINKSLREWKRRAFPFSITPPEAMDEFWTVRYIRGTMPPQTTIKVFTEKVDPSGNTLISWTGNDYWEETPTGQLTFSYRLNEGEWSEFSRNTSLVLTNLNSGKHFFEVRAMNHDFNIESNPAGISFQVSPPIWKQPWFIFLVISFLTVIGLYEARVISRNKRLVKLNASLSGANQTLETRQAKIQLQKEKILEQKEELEKKTISLEEMNTEIIQQRDQLREMVEKVEELSRIKQRFFTNISHEFRTPLTLILGSIERLLSSPEGEEKPRLNKAYETIQNNSRRILRLINQILEIRKVETDTLELVTTRLDIVEFTGEIVALFCDLAGNQGIELRFETPHEKLEVLFDPDKIEKILTNLLSNAFKATPSGGKILVTLRHIPLSNGVSSESGGGNLLFEIMDTGRGIASEHITHIFDRFYQVDESFAHYKFGTSGIGLSYARDLVTIHNGKIWVESQVGKGSTFWFEIPYVRGESKEARSNKGSVNGLAAVISKDTLLEIENLNKAALSNAPQHNPLHENASPEFGKDGRNLILIVEDEPELREFIREMLESEYEVIEAKHGEQGYQQALSYQPDLIITDVMMPQMDGNELCNKLKNNLATNHIPIIILTAKTTPENKLEGYQTGADAYIEKPFSMEFLKIRINNLLTARLKTRDKILRELISQPSEVQVHSVNDKMLHKIKEVLEENISNSDFDVESMSQYFFLSRYHFSRKVKQITGLTPKEIIDSFRLKRAGQLLQQQKLPINEVAYMVGFDHPNSFSRAFRKYYNMSPTEFASQN